MGLWYNYIIKYNFGGDILDSYMLWSEEALMSEIDRTRRDIRKFSPYTQEFKDLVQEYNAMCEAFYEKFGYGAYQD